MAPSLSRPSRKPVICLIAVIFQSLIAVTAISLPGWSGYSSRKSLFGDVWIYFCYAEWFAEGKLPYRDFPVEYPILAVPLFLAPWIAGSSFEVYRSAFVGLMLLANAAIVWLVAGQVEESEGIDKVAGRLGWYSLYFAALCPLVVVRYDLVPTFLGFASACSLARGRTILGGFQAGLGVLVKLVPGLVLVPFLAGRASLRRKLNGVLGIGLTVACGALGWRVFAGERWLSMLQYHSERGIQIESLYGSAYLVAHKLFGLFVVSQFDHGSMNVFATGARDAATLSVILQGALLLLVAGRTWHAPSGQEIRLTTACLLSYLITGKVFSPQYLVWLIPFVCAMDGPIGSTSRKIFLACCVLTTCVFPWLFRSLVQFDGLPVAILATRNLLLVVLFVVVLGPRTVTPTRSSPAVCS